MLRTNHPLLKVFATLLVLVSNVLGGLHLGCCCKRAAFAGESCCERLPECDAAGGASEVSAVSECCSSSQVRASACCDVRGDERASECDLPTSDPLAARETASAHCCDGCESQAVVATPAVLARQLPLDISESVFLPLEDYHRADLKAGVLAQSFGSVASSGRRQAQLGIWLN
ncbi:MAG TPA: hypothetical protein DDW52_06990 [Planctomycetaceae bacterium]|nr:hypothetical protein [Planctomycetaceae bacterium]